MTIDTLRADKLEPYGHGRPTSPELDAFARTALVFERAQATSSWTLPTLASVMTARYPAEHGCVSFETALDDTATTLAELLRAEGFRTAGFSASIVAGDRYGFHQGFETFAVFDVLHTDPLPVPAGGPNIVTTSPWVADRAIEWLDARASSAADERWFLWVHYFDPHAPYVPHPEFSEGLTRAAEHRTVDEGFYEGEIAYTDHHVGRLLRKVGSLGLDATTAIVVLADHGEEFLDHGGTGHKRTLFEEVMRVPLMLRAPGLAPGRATEQVSQVDVLPTALDMLGLSPLEASSGISLLGQRPAERSLFAALLREEGAGELHSVMRGRWKLVLASEAAAPELYDLETDPGEQRNVAGQNPDVVRELSLLLEDHAARASGAERAVSLTPEEREHLRSLGYTGMGE